MANVFTDAGKAITTNRLKGVGGVEPSFVAWGTGAGTAAVADTTLFTVATDETFIAGASTQETTTITDDTYQVIGTITCITGGKTITNAGLFDAATAGNMLMKGDFTGVVLAINDAIQFTMSVQYTD